MRRINLIPMAGRGIRFVNAGYETPKPLIEIGGLPMVIRAAKCLPKADLWIFICRREHIINSKIEQILHRNFSPLVIIPIDYLTDGQASTCLLAKNYLRSNDILTIGSCDNKMSYNRSQYNEKLIKSDALVWTFRNNQSIVNNPKMYGWAKLDKKGKISKISCKKPLSDNPIKDHALIGAFSFYKAEYFLKYSEKIIKKNRRINNEFYLDIVLDECVSNGLNINPFEVLKYTSWGTPKDLKNYLKYIK